MTNTASQPVVAEPIATVTKVPKKSKLKAVAPSEVNAARPKFLLFGKAGIGKTFFALTFPNVYYIDTEGGASRSQYMKILEKSNGVYFGIEQGSQDPETVINEIKTLATEEHDYKTLVIDSVTKLYNVLIASELDRMERIGEADAFGRSTQRAKKWTRRLINFIDRLDMNVVLISHEKGEWEDQKQIGWTFDCFDKLEYELDLVMRVIKHGDERKCTVRKTRHEGFSKSAAVDLKLSAFAEIYGKKEIDRVAVPIVLASPESCVLLHSLIKEQNIDEERVTRWLTKAKATAFNEMLQCDVDALIKHLEQKKEIEGKLK